MRSGPSSPAEARAAPLAAVCVVVPAYNEAATVGRVVAAVRAAGVGSVVVVDDGSTDGTAEAAAAAGADVVRLGVNRGKGGALEAGALAAVEDVVVLLDADLVGLAPEHVRALAGPVLAGEVDMTRGIFTGGRFRTSLAQRVTPQLSGQRALRRQALLAVPGLGESRYGVEVAITRHAIREGWRFVDVPLPGVSQVMKEEKRGLLKGLAARARMYADIVAALLGRDERR